MYIIVVIIIICIYLYTFVITQDYQYKDMKNIIFLLDFSNLLEVLKASHTHKFVYINIVFYCFKYTKYIFYQLLEYKFKRNSVMINEVYRGDISYTSPTTEDQIHILIITLKLEPLKMILTLQMTEIYLKLISYINPGSGH